MLYSNSTSTSTPTATVLEVTGQTFSLTTADIQIPTASGTIPDIGALLTLDNWFITLMRTFCLLYNLKRRMR